MKNRKLTLIETPYEGISTEQYQTEKRRLQIELLRIQQQLIKNGSRMAVVFEGRDAAGKGSTIKRFMENLIPSNAHVVALGIPSDRESKQWFRRYERYLPEPGNMTFFDRSWYSRALIEPTMGYCSEKRYKYFMKNVLRWEHSNIESGLLMVKFYLSINQETQLFRFGDRLSDPLTYWKFSENDLHARRKWKIFTQFKEQMFSHTSSDMSPWVVIAANKKREARLTAMLYLVRAFGRCAFEPLTGKDVKTGYSIQIGGVKFSNLSLQQTAILKHLINSDKNTA
ncbi:MAG: polyphosphate kinase [Cellvibrionales bacterium TMED49]|nr:polyphosphate kinase [Porticoccaceae bacterium]OUU38555.1 MAG: polyphosphate kinase [Cellvibrionales bacterium TMED49]